VDLVTRQSPAVDALRAMKLLTAAEIFAHTERRLRAVCAEVFHFLAIAQDQRVWEAAYEELLRVQFVRVAADMGSAGEFTLVIRKDAYFDAAKVLADYPNPHDPGQLARHLLALQAVFVTLEDEECLFALGNAFYNRSEYGKALAAYDEALTLRPDAADTWYNKGVALALLGRGEEALVACDRALALRPDDANTWHNKGFALGQLGRYEEALAVYDEALALRPDDAATWNSKGYALLLLERHEDAVSAIDRALALEPENADWWDSRGEILLAAGRWQEALTAYDGALARSPTLASSQQGKAQALRALGREAEADTLEEGSGG
jgi:tetratricopeptide (TPR) repeat protein